MADLLYVVVTVAFFAVTAGFVSLCDRIIGPDSDHGDTPAEAADGPTLTTAGDHR